MIKVMDERAKERGRVSTSCPEVENCLEYQILKSTEKHVILLKVQEATQLQVIAARREEQPGITYYSDF